MGCFFSFFVQYVNHVPCHTSLVSEFSRPTSLPTRLKFGCTTLCAHVERALELFLPTRFRQTIRDRGTDDSRYPQRPDNPQVTAAMRYIHSQEILEIPEGGTFHHFPFFDFGLADSIDCAGGKCVFDDDGKEEVELNLLLLDMRDWTGTTGGKLDRKSACRLGSRTFSGRRS